MRVIERCNVCAWVWSVCVEPVCGSWLGKEAQREKKSESGGRKKPVQRRKVKEIGNKKEEKQAESGR